MSFNYVGQAPLAGDSGERYFYALRRDDDGQLFISKVDKASPTDAIQINRPGGTDGNYTEFQAGESFFEGRNPSNINLSLDNPLDTIAGIRAVAPGKHSTFILFLIASLMSKNPGSEIEGVPASDIKPIFLPFNNL